MILVTTKVTPPFTFHTFEEYIEKVKETYGDESVDGYIIKLQSEGKILYRSFDVLEQDNQLEIVTLWLDKDSFNSHVENRQAFKSKLESDGFIFDSILEEL